MMKQSMQWVLVLSSLGWVGCAAGNDAGDDSVDQDKSCTADNPFPCAPSATATWGTTLEPRSADGTGNNLNNPNWGASFQALRRNTTVSYGDGISSPARDDGPSARAISNAMSAQTAPMPNSIGASNFIWQWGQFLDHDLDLSTDANAGQTETYNVAVPSGDTSFDPSGTGTATIPLARAGYIVGSSPRAQLNKLTSFIDASNIYGSDPTRAAALRANDGTGRLLTSPGNLLPFNTNGLPNATNPNDPNQANLFFAGDVRCNEQLGLTSMHTLWMREHNRLAGLLHKQYPKWTDEQVYQTARSVVNAEEQHITYDTWLPILVGADAVTPYQGYDDSVDPRIEALFTNLYRVGHTFLPPALGMMDNNGKAVLGGQVSLRDAFFHPDFYIQGAGIEPVLMGLAKVQAQEVDPFVIDDVRNFLFGAPGQGGLDLVSLNIQRAREFGLPSYNQSRIDYGLAPAKTWADISSNPTTQAHLAAAYANIDQVDPWIGALSEDHVKGALVGELLQTVIADQFLRVRDGDRFYYEAYLPQYLTEWVKKQTLGMVIERNTTIGTHSAMQSNVFFVKN